MTEHAPTPWTKGATLSTHNHPSRYWETDVARWTQDSRGAILIAKSAGASLEEAEANAALIVKAVNLHDVLVKALVKIEYALRKESLTDDERVESARVVALAALHCVVASVKDRP